MISKWSYRPTISLLLPVYQVNEFHLAECLKSVESQIYPYWELCIVEDKSGMPGIQDVLTLFADIHRHKVKLIFHSKNQGIASTTQDALSLATGEFISLLDHDDRLAPEALYEVASVLNKSPEIDWIYSDNDKISESGERCEYHPKPGWSPELLLTYNPKFLFWIKQF